MLRVSYQLENALRSGLLLESGVCHVNESEFWNNQVDTVTLLAPTLLFLRTYLFDLLATSFDLMPPFCDRKFVF